MNRRLLTGCGFLGMSCGNLRVSCNLIIAAKHFPNGIIRCRAKGAIAPLALTHLLDGGKIIGIKGHSNSAEAWTYMDRLEPQVAEEALAVTHMRQALAIMRDALELLDAAGEFNASCQLSLAIETLDQGLLETGDPTLVARSFGTGIVQY
jgi:hypothetical protein